MSMMKVEVQQEHRWLDQLLGDWTCEMTDGPTLQPWIETVRSLHGVWYLAEARGAMPDGTPTETVMTLGYDPARGHYVGTWIGSMMSHLWIYRGTLDPAGRTLTLASEGPDFEKPGGTAQYEDVIDILSPTRRTLTSRILKPDGSRQQIMQVVYDRKG